ncbi:melanoma inhibitory activity protein 2 isoform X3 [Arvicola amphibius]|uniref:melanoma inhibitory activity protein 2 isoform X3 n=1 Tax=Arvicola amphibius TaxID=1047088 RepID=UPI0018E37AC1|nr:melanoma inhibitory activity protein 2 isoform X3 [Arvicola amphibius]
MAEISVPRILLLLISLAKVLECTKLLAHLKKCGDLECETLISRVLALTDHTGPDCRYLNFTEGEEISVYVKLAGEREDLWAGSKGKDFGFFPRDAVQIEEVFISEEVEMPTKESDFLCLLGEGYIFGSEHSELNSDGDGNMYPYEEYEDQNYNIYESDFQPELDFYAASKGTLFEDQISASETREEFKISNEHKDLEEAGSTGSGEQGYTSDMDHDLPEMQGLFRLGREEEQTFKADSESTQESSSQTRELTVEEENDPEKLSNGEPQMEPEQDPEAQFDSETPEFSPAPEELYELVSESENTLKPQATGWFGGGFTSYLGFGEEDTGLELLSKEHNLPLQDVPNSVSADEEAPATCFGEEDTGLELLSKEHNPPLQDVPNSVSADEEAPAPGREVSADKEDKVINDSSIPSPTWFDFGFGILGFAYADEDKSVSDDDGKREDGEAENHKHPIANDFDPGKEQESRMITVVETEDQTGKESALEKTDGSDSMQYLKKFFYNPWSSQSLPEDTELPFSTQTLDQDNIAERDKTENSAAESTKEPMVLEGTNSLSDMASEVELPVSVHEGTHSKSSPPKRNEEDSESWEDPEGPAVADADGSVEGALLGSQLVSQQENDAEFQILKYLFQIDVFGFMNSAFSTIEIFIERVVAALPEDMKAEFSANGFSVELVICVLTVGLLVFLLFLWRAFRSIQSRFYVGRERKLALELSALIEEKCKLLDKFSLVQKEFEGLESALKEANFDKKSEVHSLEFVEGSQISEATCENLEKSKSELKDEILLLEKELEEERAKHCEQDELMADISKTIESLEDESKSLKSQVAEAKTTFKVFEINEERLKGAIKEALNEKSELEEGQKQLLQEAEAVREQMNELNKQKVTLVESRVQEEQVVNEKENQIKALMENLVKMKVWTVVFREDSANNGNLGLEVKNDLENAAHLGIQLKGALDELINASKLSVSLKALEGERNQFYTQLSELEKIKKNLTERIRSLESENVSLESEGMQLENEKQRLQQKIKVLTELYQENEMKLHRKLTVEENCRLEKEEKISKLDERISHANQELETYRQRTKDLEEELEKTVHSLQGQVISHEKKAHDNWLAARTFERNLNDLRKENAYNRQKLTETEFKLELLEKDPYALDVPNTAFGRGSRGPENFLDHQMNIERGDSNYDRVYDAPRAPSDSSLSPPWEHGRRVMAPPPGQPYFDPSLQKQDRFYSNSGRLSGPAELRSYNMPSLDKMDGPVPSKMESGKNDTKDDPGNSAVPGPSRPVDCEAAGRGSVPPPFLPVRAPLFPVNLRSQFMRRAPPFPPPPPGNIYAAPRDYFPPRDFPGPPPPLFPGRNVFVPPSTPQLRGFPPYLPARAGFFPPPPHPESRSELPPDLISPSKEPAAKPPETPEI